MVLGVTDARGSNDWELVEELIEGEVRQNNDKENINTVG